MKARESYIQPTPSTATPLELSTFLLKSNPINPGKVSSDSSMTAKKPSLELELDVLGEELQDVFDIGLEQLQQSAAGEEGCGEANMMNGKTWKIFSM